MNIFLQIFFYFDVFIIGALCATAARHAYAHFRPHPDSGAKPEHPAGLKEPPLSKEVRDKLLLDSQQRYQTILDRSAEQLSKELGVTTEKINDTVKKLAAEIITKELEGFEQLFKQYQQQTVEEFDGAKSQGDAYQAELKQKLDAEAEKERQRLSELIDNKLADSVMSFLVEAMQHEVDLGAQSDYLIKLLDKHKEEFKQAIKS